MSKRNLLGIAGTRTVSVEIKIPNGPNCLKCKAKHKFLHFNICLLYGTELSGHSRRIWGTSGQGPFGGSKEAWVVEKCAACLNGAREYAIAGQKKEGIDK